MLSVVQRKRYWVWSKSTQNKTPGALARSAARPPGMQTVALRPFSPITLIHEVQLSVTSERMCNKYW